MGLVEICTKIIAPAC